MNILFIDDHPESKVKEAINYLSDKVKFNYTILKSSSSALFYISQHLNEVDLVVVDLGLPRFDNGHDYDKMAGWNIVESILLETLSIPIIINSTTKIEPCTGQTEEEYFKFYHPAIIKHVFSLEGKWLYDFIEKHLKY